MKNTIIKILLISIAFITASSTDIFSQQTIVLQPDGISGNDAFVWTSFPDSSFDESSALDVTGWTLTGTPYVSRVFLSFDLSSIPSSAVITNALLTLYHNPTNGGYNGVHSGLNASILQRVTMPWIEDTITWNSQPTTTSANEIFLPATVSGTQNFIDIDVLNLINDMLGVPDSSFGFMLRLQVEAQYRDLIFASSNHVSSAIHPRLEITYNNPTSLIEAEDQNSELSVFPNPAHNQITIQALNKKYSKFEIIDITGRVVWTQKITGYRHDIDVSNLNNGIYLIELQTDDGKWMARFMKY